MNKFKTKLLLTLFILLNISSLNAQGKESSSQKSPPPKQYTSILQAVLSIFKSPESRFITRRGDVCLISPGNSGKELVWSDRPLFIWRGKTVEPQINVFSSVTNDDSPASQEIIWSEAIPANTQTIAYAGEKLQSGLSYEWEFISRGKPSYRQSIVLLEESQRKAIASELTSLLNQLPNNATDEDIAIAKADYFLQRELGSDALQELYSVENPSSNLTSKIQEIEENLCNLER